MADLEITLSKFSEAQDLCESSLSIAPQYYNYNKPSITGLLNTAAYVYYSNGKYKTSDTLYWRLLKTNSANETLNSLNNAIALNGLGLLEQEKRNYSKAEGYFKESLIVLHSILTGAHPQIAIINLNYGVLFIEENKLVEAEEMLNKSLDINKIFFKPDHDIFGDIFVAMGDLAKKKRQPDVAKDYYRKAYDIYAKKFNEHHWKVISTKGKIIS